jgi:hypothetical protein
MAGPHPIVWPTSSFPGNTPQESAGRLINCTAEPLGPGGPAPTTWHRQPGLTAFATTTQTGYRGGLAAGGVSYECWSGEAVTVSNAGLVTLLGSFPGTQKVSIAHNQASSPNVIAVDITNGAFLLSGGGVPSAYNGSGILPQVNSVAFQDGYLIFTTASGQVWHTALNSTSMNALTFVQLLSKSDVTLYRGIAYSQNMFFFTSGGMEIWQDAGNTYPAFAYNRLVTLPFGLIQANAIAGWETGFDNLFWVAPDYGVYNLTWGSVAPAKVSPPDLDRLIEAQVVAGNTLDAAVYMFAGKKFFVISSPAWSWEFNVGTSAWNERWSLNLTTGIQGRWRATGSHPAFGYWLMGDTQSGTLAYVDDSNYTELGAPQLWRMEGLVPTFPNRTRVARADFDYATGVGQATGATPNIVNPQVAISWSDNDGLIWKNPLMRSLGLQGASKTTRVTAKHTGLTGNQARRWRLDITDPVKTAFMGATQSDNPAEF